MKFAIFSGLAATAFGAGVWYLGGWATLGLTFLIPGFLFCITCMLLSLSVAPLVALFDFATDAATPVLSKVYS